MGGANSGRRWRYDSKPVIEDGLVLSISRLMQNQSLRSDEHVSGVLTWSVVRTGRKVASIGYEADLRDPDKAWLRLHYLHDEKPQDYKVSLITTRPNFGGVRWWFVCPVSGARVAKLYSPPGQPLFAGRQVFKVAYRSQNMDWLSRRLDKAQEIRLKLGGEASLDWPFPERPKGMHRKTYHRLKAQEAHLSRSVCVGFARKFGMDLF